MEANPSIKAFLLLVLVAFFGAESSCAKLSADFYAHSCPKLLSTVKHVVRSAVSNEPRMGASLIRLFFHDCFVNGCDASILLDDTPRLRGEKTARPNNNSIRGYDVIDKIKSKLERICPGVVSCADILALAARDSVVLLGGPNWGVELGRRDTRRPNLTAANSGVIPPPTSTLSNLVNRFKAKGLNTKDLVALSGAHTVGQAACTSFRDRIYEEEDMDPSFAKLRRKCCTKAPGPSDNSLAPLDHRTPTHFDNNYYDSLIANEGLLHSDQILLSGGATGSLVRTYGARPKRFSSDFAAAMVKMGGIDLLTGTSGEIRKRCRSINRAL